MKLTPPTFYRATQADAMPYIGLARQQMAVLQEQMRLSGLNTATRRVRLDNGVEIICTGSFGKFDMYVNIPKVVPVVSEVIVEESTIKGFLAQPRAGAVRGFMFPGHDTNRTPTYGIAHTGIGFKYDDIDTDSIVSEGDYIGVSAGEPYPLVDDDARTYHFYYDEDASAWKTNALHTYSYGNVDWKGKATTSPADRRILTYKGNPSRYWAVSVFLEIPGLSTVDQSFDGINTYEYMTVFGDKVYEGGTVLATMPQLYYQANYSFGSGSPNWQNARVLGAAIRESDNLLICIVKTCYTSYPRYKLPTDKDVSAWHIYQNGLFSSDYLEDKKAAEQFISDNPDNGYTLVEFTDIRGHYVEVIAQQAGDIAGGWKRLGRFEHTGTIGFECNFFFSEDGTKAVSVERGKIWEVAVTGDTATCTLSDVGGFEVDLKTTTNIVQEINEGEPIPTEIPQYRQGVESGDWIIKTDTTKVYTATKSGETVIAADYKGNTLVRLTAKITGTETHNYFRRIGFKWGETALPGALWTNTESRWLKEPLVHWNMNGIGSVISPSVAQGACKPTCNVSVINMALETPSTDGTGCDATYRITGCVTPGSLAQACITTVTNAANGTASRTDCIILAGIGSWTPNEIPDTRPVKIWAWMYQVIGEATGATRQVKAFYGGYGQGNCVQIEIDARVQAAAQGLTFDRIECDTTSGTASHWFYGYLTGEQTFVCP